MKKNKSTIILILVFFVGLSVMLYPTLSDYVNQLHQSRAVATYAEDVDNLTDADYSAYFEAADAFNAQIAADPDALFHADRFTSYNATLDVTGTGIMGSLPRRADLPRACCASPCRLRCRPTREARSPRCSTCLSRAG